MNAFVDLIRERGGDRYDFSLRETQTYEIIEDVAQRKSEIGLLYLNDFNRTALQKLLRGADLDFTPLFTAHAHVFLSSDHPLSGARAVSFDDLAPYPYLSFEQEIIIPFIFRKRSSARQCAAKYPGAGPRHPV